MAMANDDFSLDSARRAADADRLGSWVADFLSSPGSDNAALAAQLSDPPRWWLGPLRLPFDRLHRLAGPEDHPVLAPLDEDDLETVEQMEDSIEDGWQPPPLVVSCRGDQLVVEDGNHRIEGLRRAGEHDGWSVVCFERPEQRDAFEALLEQERDAADAV